MARASSRKSDEARGAQEKPTFEELVSPDGERRETPLNAATDAHLRFSGWLPEEQHNAESPRAAERDSGSSTLQAGAEKTVGSNES